MPNKTILRVDASMRKTSSMSRLLTNELIDKLGTQSSNRLIHRDLADGVSIIDEKWVLANFTDSEQRTDLQKQVLAESDKLIDELDQADTLVISTPIYNFGVPAALKAWIDQVCRARKTFQYTEQGPVGLLSGKMAYVVVTSGGTQLGSEIDFVSNWLRHVLGFIGIDDVTFIDGSGLMVSEQDAMNRAQDGIARVA